MLQNLKTKLSKVVRNSFLYISSIIIIKKDLVNVNLTQLKPLKISSWHHGYMYFKGYLNNTKVFIKVDTKYFLLYNELKIRELFNKDVDFTKLLLYKKGRYEYLFFKFIKYEILNIEFIKEKGVSFVLSELLSKIKKINNKGVLHRDIKLDNFIIIDNQIVLNDYVYSISNKIKGFKDVDLNIQGLKLLEDLNKSNKLYWDDMESLYREVLRISNHVSFSDQELKEFKMIMDDIKKQIGKNYYRY